ncbi:MAG: translation initiation factor IF-2 [Culicoidibacterales bacterium]
MSEKIRVREYAEQNNLQARDVVTVAQQLNMNVRNAMTLLSDQEVQQLNSKKAEFNTLLAAGNQARPQRDGERPQRDGERRPANNGPRRDGDRPQRDGERRPFNNNGPRRDGDRPQRDGERRPFNNDRPRREYRPSAGERLEPLEAAGERRPYYNNKTRGITDGEQLPNSYRPMPKRTERRSYNNDRPAGGQGGQRPYNNDRPAGGQRSYNNDRPAGGQGRFNNNDRGGQRPAGGQGGQGRFNNDRGGQRPTGGQGGQGRFNNDRGGQRPGGQQGGRLERQIADIKTDAQAQVALRGEDRPRVKREDKNWIDVVTDREEKKSIKQRKDEERRNLRRRQKEKQQEENRRRQEEARKNSGPKVIKYVDTLTVSEFSHKLGVQASEIIKYLLLELGVMATLNQELSEETIELLATENNAIVEREVSTDATDLDKYFEEVEGAQLKGRPAVITIMGHVDHGKTTLLDTIRNTRVVAGEAGGITQHIGAYQINHDGKVLTFLDTPGHEAFTTMRARGAQVTDIAIIVVAADDGVMPQTREAIEHAKAAEVPMIVAVNKIDKPGANPDRVMQELAELGVLSEAWGGDTIFVQVSAKEKIGIDELIEMILLTAEVNEYKANPDRLAVGTVIEARLDKGRGPVATLLVQSGTLRVGDPVVVGNTYGRVRTMEDDLGNRLTEATPSTPVELTGLVGVPAAGDKFAAFDNEKQARQIGEERTKLALVQQRSASSAMSLEDLAQQILEGDIKEVNVIVKADVQGSVEAVVGSFNKIDVNGVRVKIIRSGAGAITESDVTLALASNAIIYGFNVRPDAKTRELADREGVSIRLHNIIYKAIEELESMMHGMLDPEFEEKILGQAEVRQLFKVSKVGTIAGCIVSNGTIERDSIARVIRDGIVIYEGKLASLKREKNDAKVVNTGYECGIMLEKFNDLKEGDVIESAKLEEVERKRK